MFVVLKYIPCEALELAPVNAALPPLSVKGATPDDPFIGFLPVYATRAAAEAASENGRYRVQQIAKTEEPA